MVRKVVLIANATEMLDTESGNRTPNCRGCCARRRSATSASSFLALFGLILTWPMRSRRVLMMTAGYAASVVCSTCSRVIATVGF